MKYINLIDIISDVIEKAKGIQLSNIPEVFKNIKKEPVEQGENNPSDVDNNNSV